MQPTIPAHNDIVNAPAVPSHESIMGMIGGAAGAAFNAVFPPRTVQYSDTAQTQTSVQPVAKPAAPSSVVGNVDWKGYATDPNDIQRISSLYNQMPQFGSPQDVDQYLQTKFPKSPLTGQIIYNTAQQYNIDPRALAARLQQESGFGTAGIGAKTKNPGNYGNTGSAIKNFPTWEAGVKSVALWMKGRVVPNAEASTGGS